MSAFVSKRVLPFLLAFVLLLSVGAEAFAEMRIDAELLPGSDASVSRTVFVGGEAVWIVIPDGKTYILYYDDLEPILKGVFGEDFLEEADGAAGEEAAPGENGGVIGEIALRYGKIFISVASIFNISRKKMEYPLSAFGTAPKCTVFSCSPSRKDWTKMLTKLFKTASTDEQLAELLPEGTDAYIAKALDNLDAIIDVVDGISVLAAYDDGGVHVLKIARREQSLSYQADQVEGASCYALVLGKAEGDTVLAAAEVTAADEQPPESAVRIDCAADLVAALMAAFPLSSLMALFK